MPPRDIPAGSLWPTSLTLPSKMCHLDLVRRMMTGNQRRLLWLLLSLLSSSESSEKDADREPASSAAAAGHSRRLHLLPLIFLGLSCKIQLIVKS